MPESVDQDRVTEMKDVVEKTTHVLELAQWHLEDAETVLWEGSKRIDDTDQAERLEALTKQVWDLQHSLMDEQRNIGTNGPE